MGLGITNFFLKSPSFYILREEIQCRIFQNSICFQFIRFVFCWISKCFLSFSFQFLCIWWFRQHNTFGKLSLISLYVIRQFDLHIVMHSGVKCKVFGSGIIFYFPGFKKWLKCASNLWFIIKLDGFLQEFWNP